MAVRSDRILTDGHGGCQGSRPVFRANRDGMAISCDRFATVEVGILALCVADQARSGDGDHRLRCPAVQRPRWLRALRARLRGPARPASGAALAPQEAWDASLDGEVAFWRNYLANEGGRWAPDYQRRIDAALPLQPEFVGLIDAPDGTTVRILDVGAGPLTYVGRSHPRWNLEVAAVDALGAQYASILDEAGVTPPVRTQACESEQLHTVIEPASFDLVTARNTLDHSYDPVLAIREMVACAKPGSPILLIHHPNEAEREQYHGMHQWNFEVTDGNLAIWRPNARHDVAAELADVATVERTWTEGTWDHVVLRRVAAAT